MKKKNAQNAEIKPFNVAFGTLLDLPDLKGIGHAWREIFAPADRRPPVESKKRSRKPRK